MSQKLALGCTGFLSGVGALVIATLFLKSCFNDKTGGEPSPPPSAADPAFSGDESLPFQMVLDGAAPDGPGVLLLTLNNISWTQDGSALHIEGTLSSGEAYTHDIPAAALWGFFANAQEEPSLEQAIAVLSGLPSPPDIDIAPSLRARLQRIKDTLPNGQRWTVPAGP